MLRRVVEGYLNRLWYGDSRLVVSFLLPFSLLYCLLVKLRYWLYRLHVLPSDKLSVSVVVVGNITVGGTGKTPLVIWLAEFLSEAGFKPGIITSGYRGNSLRWPQMVTVDSNAVTVGDEAVLLAQRTNCSVVAGPDRLACARELVGQGCTVLLSDDGLQHYALQRDIEIALVDAEREFGNGYCLPAGPLREPDSRLKSVDMVVYSGEPRQRGWGMDVTVSKAYALADERREVSLADFQGDEVHAIAGVAHPEKFFKVLRDSGLKILGRPFPDHHRFSADDLVFADEKAVLMTEKDAVKCRRFPPGNCWVVPARAELDEGFGEALLELLQKFTK